MKPSALSSLSVLSLLIGTLSLVGCGGAMNMPDSVMSSQGAAPPIVGAVYGGHAPIAGSHVYLLQAGTANYGGAGTGATLGIATSLLGKDGETSTVGGPILTNAATGGDHNIPAGWQYVVTDANGAFNLTGGYSCTAGEPVYIYSFGGNATGGSPITANNTAIVLLAVLGNCPANLTPPVGNTPGTGNFSSGSTALSFLYVNEVSTVAAAYVFQPFSTVATTAALSSAIYVGSSGTTQGVLGIEDAALTAGQLYDIQGGGTLSTVPVGEGHVANFRTGGFTEEFVGGIPTFIPTINSGNGIVPQAVIDTLANIIAGCVDSTGPTSTQCTNLFANTRETGDSAGIAPTDTARAIMNLARYPAGNNSTANTPSNLTTIFALGQVAPPYTPHLTTTVPNDFTLAILYPFSEVHGYGATNGDVERAESIAVDNLGQIWITAQGAGGGGTTTPSPSADRWSPLGVVEASNNTFANGNYIYGYVSIDGGNNAWTGNADSTTGMFFAGSNGSFTTTFGAGFTQAYTVVANQAGDAFFFASNAGGTTTPTTGPTYNTGTESQMWEYNGSGTLLSSSATCNGHTAVVYNCISPSVFPNGDFVAHGAIDTAGHLWLTSEDGDRIARVSPAGVADFTIAGLGAQPEFPAIDAGGNGWIPGYSANEVYKVTSAGVRTNLTSASTGGTLDNPFGSAIDGNNNLWVTIRCGGPGNNCNAPEANASTLVEINTTNGLAISPPNNYSPVAWSTTGTVFKVFTDPLNVAIDPSGNLWITNYDGTTPANSSVVEIVGAAAPVVTPLSVAAGTSKFGVKP
jgi:hypothetical protein